MATIADNIAELMRIKLEQRDFFGIAEDVPFADYIDIIKWTGHEVPQQPMYADFVNHRYALNGKPCRFQDIFEFIRLSKAWDFTESGLKEYGIDEPRISDKGLLIEPESTNHARYTKTLTKDVWGISSTSFVNFEDLGGFHRMNIEKPTTWTLYNSNMGRIAEYINVDIRNHKGPDQTAFTKDASSSNRVSFNLNNGTLLNSGNNVNGYVNGSVYTFHRKKENLATFGLLGADYNEGDFIDIYGIKVSDKVDFTSAVPTEGTTVTRLPDTLRLLQTGVITIDADEGIVQDGKEFSGFGYIRKIEIK